MDWRPKERAARRYECAAARHVHLGRLPAARYARPVLDTLGMASYRACSRRGCRRQRPHRTGCLGKGGRRSVRHLLHGQTGGVLVGSVLERPWALRPRAAAAACWAAVWGARRPLPGRKLREQLRVPRGNRWAVLRAPSSVARVRGRAHVQWAALPTPWGRALTWLRHGAEARGPLGAVRFESVIRPPRSPAARP